MCSGHSNFAVNNVDLLKSSWLYLLQKPTINSIAKSGFSIAVFDYSKDGSDKKKFSKEEIKYLVDKNITPIAYISIGEAESYRYYWDRNWLSNDNSNQFSALAPKWLGKINPYWQGNYKVRFWDPDWRDRIIKPYLDKILNQGFAGIYLDIIDAFEYWADQKIYEDTMEIQSEDDPSGNEKESARRMIDLVTWIAFYCRSKSPYGDDFLIIPQNGERILLHDTQGIYMNTVSGIGVEETWYDGEQVVPHSIRNNKLRFLSRFVRKGKLVLSVDYVDNGNHKNSSNINRINNYISKCRFKGFHCYAAHIDAELKIINRIPGIQPHAG